MTVSELALRLVAIESINPELVTGEEEDDSEAEY